MSIAMCSIGTISIAFFMSSLLVSGQTSNTNCGFEDISSDCERKLNESVKYSEERGLVDGYGNPMDADWMAGYWICNDQIPAECQKDGGLQMPCGRDCSFYGQLPWCGVAWCPYDCTRDCYDDLRDAVSIANMAGVLDKQGNPVNWIWMAGYWVCINFTVPSGCREDGGLKMPCEIKDCTEYDYDIQFNFTHTHTHVISSGMGIATDWYSWYQIHYYHLMVFMGLVLVTLCGLNVHTMFMKEQRKHVRYAAVKCDYDSDTEYEVPVKPVKK